MEEARGLKALNIWCKKVTKGYKDINIKDMSSSWRDGLAFCAIIHHYRPDLIDFDSLSKENILYNNSVAFSIAEKQLGVPALLDAEDMEKFEQMDKLSIITYLSQLYNCFENQNKLNKVQPAIKRLLTEGESGPPAKVFSIEQKVSGGRKHDICLACKHRVYILERLIVGGKLYHRTCFKCCKCDALLKPGAYVEGENPGKYECAICPHDELNDLSAESVSHNEGSQDEVIQNFKLSHRSCDSLPGNDSSVEAPKLSLLSSSVNNARNSFMQRSFSSSSGNQECKANESIPVATEPNELPTSITDYLPSDIQKATAISDMDKNATGVETESAKSREVAVRESVITKEFLHTHSPQHSFSSSLLSEHKESFPSSSQRYKSVFLHDKIKTLKPLKIDFETNDALKMAKETPSASVSFSPGPHSPDSIKAMNFNLPTIKSATYLSPIKASKSLPRPSSIANFHSPKEITPHTLSPVGRKGSSDGSLNEIFHDKWSKVHRKGSLDSDERGTISLSRAAVGINKEMFHAEEKVDKIIKLKDTETKQVTHEKRKAEEPNENLSHYLKKNSKGDRCTEKNEDLAPKGIVKQLIQQRELSLAVSKTPMISKLKFIDSSQKMTCDIPVSKKSDILELETEKIEKKLQKQELPIPDFKQQEVTINQPNKTAKNNFIEEKYSNSCVPTKLQDKIPNITETEITLVNKNEDTEERITSSGTKDGADEYPDDLNPFDDDNFNGASGEFYPEMLNPFGDSDEENDLKIQTEDKHNDIYDESMNPFASDDEDQVLTAITRNTTESRGLTVSESVVKNRVPIPTVRTSIIAKNTEQYFPQLQHASSQQSIDFTESPTGTLRGTQKKRKAPAPPLLKDIFGHNEADTSKDSPCILITSPYPARLSKTPSPKPHKSKPAPPPPALFSTVQANRQDESSTSSTGDCVASGKQTKDMDNMKLKSFNRSLPTINANEETTKNDPSTNNQWKKKKRPAPPVPIPPRREIKKIPLKEIQSEMTEIEEKQEELERHGRELEVMIRDRDKDEEPTVEEEELIMQLFELVNQKNALFRRQAELMYIKRSQRLEEEQVELEYQIRCLMLKPVSQKTEEDIHCEEELVQRLLDVVDQRNEIVDSIEMDRRREAEEDISVQEQMDIKNSDLPITAEIKEKSVHKEKKSKHKHKEKGKDKKKHQEDSKDGTEEMGKRNTIHKIKKWF